MKCEYSHLSTRWTQSVLICSDAMPTKSTDLVIERKYFSSTFDNMDKHNIQDYQTIIWFCFKDTYMSQSKITTARKPYVTKQNMKP